jgi:hypothetical protein
MQYGERLSNYVRTFKSTSLALLALAALAFATWLSFLALVKYHQAKAPSRHTTIKAPIAIPIPVH